eukprot:scaffold7312_cov116-Isochrysis_galbana.AAC.4
MAESLLCDTADFPAAAAALFGRRAASCRDPILRLLGLSQHTSPPYHRAPPSLVGAVASYPPSSYPRRAPRVRA